VSAALRIGTRASKLALWQAEHVAQLVRAQPGAPEVTLVRITTQGDAQSAVPLWQVEGRAFFTREIDSALLAGTIDVAVHSLKDLATELEPGTTLAATLAREDPRDALIGHAGATLTTLAAGARIGTSSLRRRAFLARQRPDVELVELRGNVPTRLERVQRGDYDAIVLAAAGLKRLGLDQHISEYLPLEAFPPAVSQGVIGVCARRDDRLTLRWLEPLEDAPARLAVTAERALLKRLEGGCQVPLGALAQLRGQSLGLSATLAALDGSQLLSVRGATRATAGARESLDAARALGEQLAEELLAGGAAALIARARGAHEVIEP
jgi:hydroxymethylbilane synthase